MAHSASYMPFDQKTINAFEMKLREAACEIPATQPSLRAFVGVYPPLPDKGIVQWRVRRFEVPSELIGSYLAEEQLLNSLFCRLDDLAQVERLLEDWGLDPASFAAPWRCDYPL